MVEIAGYDPKGWVAQGSIVKSDPNAASAKGTKATVIYAGSATDLAQILEPLSEHMPTWQHESIAKAPHKPVLVMGPAGPIWAVASKELDDSEVHGGYLDPSEFAQARNVVGGMVRAALRTEPEEIYVGFHGATPDEKIGGLVGAEMASYEYKRHRYKKGRLPKLHILGVSQTQADQAAATGTSVNLARHLVNLPSEELNPKTYASFIQKLFKGSTTSKVTVLSGEQLKKKNCGMLEAVGRAAVEGPRIVHIRYRPKGSKNKKPSAFVGKGITFDSGGLDLKPPDGMRNMKKDMGGSAAVVGLAWWLECAQHGHPCDLYLAIAENAVDERAFRPGDVLTSASGKTVEIHNTDAEGRLVMGDVLWLAANQKGADEPQHIVNVATLTGAMKVALGAKVYGFFANNDRVADRIADAAWAMGEPAWRLPLYQPYKSLLKSRVADMTNAASSRFGGSITAALFLEEFVNKKPWAHMDIFAWSESSGGPIAEPGASGQAVQTLIGFVMGKR